MRVYDWTMLFLAHGIATFPVRYRDKRPKLKSWEMYKSELPSFDNLTQWFAGGSMHNYGVAMGWGDLAVLDFDDMGAFYKWQAWTFGQPSGSPADIMASTAFTVQTSRGLHLYYRTTEQGHNRHVNGIDIKRAGYVLGPGSTHPSGSPYRATNAFNIPQIDTLESILPPEWYEKLQNQPDPEISMSAKMPTLSDDPFDVASSAAVYDDGVSLVQQVKERHKIQSFFTELVPSSNGYMMTACPFHDDHSPSFWIDTKRQIANCNKCQFPRPMDVINLYAKMQGIDDQTALRILANLA